MPRGADLFVVCKNPKCGSEVSPYVTECPYCGTRLRKRAPKLQKAGGTPTPLPRPGPRPRSRPGSGRKRSWPRLGQGSRPALTIALVVASCGVWLAWRGGLVDPLALGVDGPLGSEWWRVLTAQFTYLSGLDQFGSLMAIAIFGWLLERRHGPPAVALVFLLAGPGATLLAAVADPVRVHFGGTGAGLGMLAAWAAADLRARRGKEYYEGDLLAAATGALALGLIPLARTEVSPIAVLAGGVVGLLVGLALAARRR